MEVVMVSMEGEAEPVEAEEDGDCCEEAAVLELDWALAERATASRAKAKETALMPGR